MPSTLVLRAGIAAITRSASDDLASLLTPTSSFEAARGQLEAVLPGLADFYGAASGTWSADWYDETRFEQAIAGKFRAVVAELTDPASINALAGWAVEPLVKDPDAFATVLTNAQGGLHRRIANVGRDTITSSSIADPEAAGWQRVGSGHNCGFCSMLIGRGAVYSERGVEFAAHDHCNCAAVPAWGSLPVPVKPFTPSARQAGDADRARARQFIAEHGL